MTEASIPEILKHCAMLGCKTYWDPASQEIRKIVKSRARGYFLVYFSGEWLVEPGTFPLAHGRSGRVAVVRPGEQAEAEAQGTHWYNRAGALKCIGNAIVPQVAATFIDAALRSIHDEFV